ncbi:ribonuclease Y [Candidatus Giovannonibacteria bacterium RIFCSPHIGHO2_01_FULL_48_47]|nr:MAG: ribonuclease Y [Candidatus Giovannonibacteria bacterium RIFCSPHIGHO2_01_FULL_48_47]OGF67802.1 MAG: ribonuclease Y [Candidatus Giovannonibacteria bacterium RIFCSPHIGHO2_02_FULL_48_15]OGF88557.1 MAG: ribonuclease Y [Candidatus Giovannonibacteria bacterium RIFCSPLOWO2_01_FULL_48_47]OGF96286.1 MAG: ribonuclease Y [Candidatus Giovannonibacteria bacterium RIFOXYD1_FULL_48_21]HBT81801.1 ribonuclease Y [Candidatus Giovannonibacteria bacterium]
MTLTSPLLVALLSVLVGTALGYVLRQIIAQYRKNSLELQVKKILLDAKDRAVEALDAAKKKADELLDQARRETKERENQLRKLEEKVLVKDEALEKRRRDLELEVENLKKKAEEIKRIREEAEKIEAEKRAQLQKIANLSEEEAKKELIESVEKKHEIDILARIQKLEIFGQDRLEHKARDILATVIQRLASSTASEVTTAAVTIPSDDIKGKIIGKEGRNIRALERAAGVEIIVDDTPGSVVISSFDPVRRQVAKIALENLILDGRIQPARIEETVEKAKNEIEKMIKDAGEKAAFEVGIFDIDPRLLMLLGRLKFRTSYGQNVLQHSIEMSHVAGMLASELGADIAIAKKGALLHDIGKAVDHEIQGTHVEIGRRILQKFNVDSKVIQAMQSHHEEYPYETLESIIVQIADAISASRPGARRDSVENYLKRLEDLERIANSFGVVEKSYAIQAGREIRVFVTPEKISDLEMKNLARDIANQIEQELKYPGEIKVHVIRENRAVEYAR